MWALFKKVISNSQNLNMAAFLQHLHFNFTELHDQKVRRLRLHHKVLFPMSQGTVRGISEKAWNKSWPQSGQNRYQRIRGKTDQYHFVLQLNAKVFFKYLVCSKRSQFYGKSSFYLNRTGSRHYHSWVLDLEHKTWYTIKSPTRATDWWDPKIDAGFDCRYTWGHGNAVQPEEVQPSEADKEVEWS